jgi:hypothetical protein
VRHRRAGAGQGQVDRTFLLQADEQHTKGGRVVLAADRPWGLELQNTQKKTKKLNK